MSADTLQSLVLWIIPVLLSLAVHEWAHAASAYALGDDTAALQGRLTLNPISHVDPIGTVALPLLQVLTTGTVLFAWAKPVPFAPQRFTRKVSMSTGAAIVSAAGPISNLLIALGSAIGLGLAFRLGHPAEPVVAFLHAMFGLNVALAVFNLIPIPPLDGSKVLHGLLPRRSALAYERLFPYAPFLLLGVFLFGGRFLHLPMNLVGGWMARLTAAIAG